MATITTGTAAGERTTGEEILAFFLHVALAVVCGLFLAYFVSAVIVRLFSTLGVRHVPDLFTQAFGPFFCLSIIALGFFVNHGMRHRSARWIGIMGILGVAVILALDYVAFGYSDYVRSLPGGFWG
jgi:hypothetical protein